MKQIATTIDDYVYTPDDEVISGEVEEGRRYREGEFNRIRAQALIPIDSENPLRQFKRVQGVGVTAIIDVKL